MSQRKQRSQTKNMGTTVVDLARRPDGTWEVTQGGLEVVGRGTPQRTTEDMAKQIAELKEAGKQ